MLKLTENWRILNTSDRELVLQKRITMFHKCDAKDGSFKQGEEFKTWVFKGYFCSLKSCLNHFAGCYIVTDAESWGEVLKRQEEIKHMISHMFTIEIPGKLRLKRGRNGKN